MRLLLVADAHHFSTLEIFNGYLKAFEQLGVQVSAFPTHEILGQYSPITTFRILTGEMLNKEYDFTHVLFVSGMELPDFVLKSKYDKKFGVIATDDPHAGLRSMYLKQHLDYYFTNEKTMENHNDNIFYVPTATSNMLPNCAKTEVPNELQYDVVFVGTIYENRIKPLEEACDWCEKNKKTIGIFAPHIPAKSELLKRHGKQVDGAVPVNTAKLMYRGAGVVLNLDRDIKWHPAFGDGDNPILLDNGKEPESLNPRAYEIGGCRVPQLFVNPRAEAMNTYGDNAWYCKEGEVGDRLDSIFNAPDEEVKKKIENCFNIVQDEHLYIHRANSILNHMKGVDYAS